MMCMKRTNIVLDEALVGEARRATGIGTIRELVDQGLRELIASRKRMRMLELKGKIAWRGHLDTWRKD